MKINLRSVVFGLLLTLESPLVAWGQCSGQAPSLTYCGNPTGALALPGWRPMGGFAVDLDVGATTITGGSNNRLLYDNAGVLGETYHLTATNPTTAIPFPSFDESNPSYKVVLGVTGTFTDTTNTNGTFAAQTIIPAGTPFGEAAGLTGGLANKSANYAGSGVLGLLNNWSTATAPKGQAVFSVLRGLKAKSADAWDGVKGLTIVSETVDPLGGPKFGALIYNNSATNAFDYGVLVAGANLGGVVVGYGLANPQNVVPTRAFGLLNTGTSNYLFEVTGSTGAILSASTITAGAGFNLTGASPGTPILTLATANHYTSLNDPLNGIQGLAIGDSTVGSANFYSGDTHTFRNRLGSANFAAISSAGLALSGSASGTATITAQAAASTPTLTLPNASGTFAVSASSPLVLNATTGALTCSTCLTANQTITLSGDVSGSGETAITTTLASVISAGGPTGSATVAPIITYDAKGRLTAVSSATITPTASSITGGAALTKTDDTNVTLTLGGTPSAALLAAASITVGWTGTLANGRLATMATNTIKGNATSGTASPSDLAMISCSTAASAVTWTTNTGPGCNTSITAAAVPASGLTGATLAAGVTASSLTSLGTITLLNATTIVATGAVTGLTFIQGAGTAAIGAGTMGYHDANWGNLSRALNTGASFSWGWQNSVGTQLMAISDAGAVQITGTLAVTAVANAATTSAICYNTGTGLFTYNSTVGTCTVSDERLKNFTAPINGALDKLLQIRGMNFTWKNPKEFGAGNQIGVSAQAVEKVFPELVKEDSLGRKSADYQRLVAPIIEALREMKAANDNLRADVADLKKKVKLN